MTELFPSNWIARPDGTNVFTEYIESLGDICILPEIMASSLIQQIISKLTKEEYRIHDSSFESFLTACLRRTFQTDNGMIRVPEIDYAGYLKLDIMGLYQNFNWERKYLHLTLFLLDREGDIRLRSLLGLLGRAQRECDARKRMAFSTLMHSVSDILTSPTAIIYDNKDHGKKEKTRFPVLSVFFSNCSACKDPSEEMKSSELTDAKERIFQHCVSKIEEYKEKAFYSTFIEPNLFYFSSKNCHVEAGDVDVHGANSLISLLQASTGICVPRLPLINDEVKGFCDFLHDGNIHNDILRELFAPENIGKSYQTCLNQLKRKNEQKGNQKQQLFNSPSSSRLTAANGRLIFNTDTYCHSVQQFVSNALLDHLPSMSEKRKRYGHYLEIFSYYFRNEFILKFLFNALIQEDRFVDDLNIIFTSMKQLSHPCSIHIPEDCDDVRFWLWSISAEGSDLSETKFNGVRAQRFFAECGICKPTE